MYGPVCPVVWEGWGCKASPYPDQYGLSSKRPSPWADLKGQALLGSDTFVETMRPLLEDRADLSEVPRSQRLLHRPSLKRLFPGAVRADKALRDEAIRKACLEWGYTMAATARAAGIHYSTVSKIIKGER